MKASHETIYFSLGYIGNVSQKFQALFSEYDVEPNRHGYFLRFVDFTDTGINEGVRVETNCFESESAFMEALNHRLIMHFAES